MPIKGIRPVDWGDEVAEIQNAAGSPLYKKVNLIWQKPTVWTKDALKPHFDSSDPFIYALVRNHGNSRTKDKIEYIGLTESPKSRFGNHATARKIVSKHGVVHFTYAKLNDITGRDRLSRIHYALNEIEHLLIWAVNADLVNIKKQYTLPGMGSNGGNAWHIVNSGYRFSGRMPREIIFPWMVVRPGRDVTRKPPK